MKTITKENLEALNVSAPNTKQHQVLLRKVLLTSSHWDKKTNFFNFMLKGGDDMTKTKKFITGSIVIGVMVIATLLAAFSPLSNKNGQTAYAEQVAQQSYQAVSSLSPDQQAALKDKFRMDSNDLLQEAKTAKDLKILTYEQFVSENPQIAQMPQPPDGIKRPDLQTAKFLQFTDKNGATVTIGVDANDDLPVFVTAMQKDGNAAFQARDGMPGLPDAKSGQVGFETTNGSGSGNILLTIGTKGGGPVLTVDGKKYAVPASVTLSPDSPPPSIQVKNGDVYVNGVKAIPEQ